MWGGMEVDKDGRTVVLNGKNTVEAVKFTLAAWKDCFDEGGLAWDDSNNNRAFLSSEISLTGNAPSIYIAARTKFPEVYKGTNHDHYPPGPAGRFYFLPCYNSCVMKYSKNQKVAKDFVRWYMDRARYDRYFEIMDIFGIPGTKSYRDHTLWKKDPKTGRLRGTARPQGDRSPVEVHPRRHVRQEHSGHAGRGRRGLGGRRGQEDLRGMSRSLCFFTGVIGASA
jgi:multiple sugar transport system substrate-binding protein